MMHWEKEVNSPHITTTSQVVVSNKMADPIYGQHLFTSCCLALRSPFRSFAHEQSLPTPLGVWGPSSAHSDYRSSASKMIGLKCAAALALRKVMQHSLPFHFQERTLLCFDGAARTVNFSGTEACLSTGMINLRLWRSCSEGFPPYDFLLGSSLDHILGISRLF